MSKSPPQPLPEFHDIRAIADRLGVSTRTVRRRIDAKELAVHRLGASVRVSDDDMRTTHHHYIVARGVEAARAVSQTIRLLRTGKFSPSQEQSKGLNN